MPASEKKFTLGRARDCDIVLADDSVSRRHAELTFLGDGKVLLTDCRSSRGTFLLAGGRPAGPSEPGTALAHRYRPIRRT